MKKIILCIIVLSVFSGISFSQTQQINSDDSLEYKKFHEYYDLIASNEIDTIISDTNFQTFRIKYITRCHYSEMIFPSSDGHEIICSTSGKSLDKNIKITTHKITKQITPATPLHLCDENLVKHTDSSSVLLKLHPYETKKTDPNNGLFLCQINLASRSHFFTPYHTLDDTTPLYEVISFNNSQYLILERSYILNIGSQTSHGTTETIFLEKLNP